MLTGRPISSFWGAPQQPASEANIFLIDWAAEALKSRIAARAAAMWPLILDEVRALVPTRYSGTEPGFQSLGYREAIQCLNGEFSSDEGRERLLRATFSYAKRQRTWFRHQLKNAVVIKGAPIEAMSEALSRHIKAAVACA